MRHTTFRKTVFNLFFEVLFPVGLFDEYYIDR
jgi:hypothetical protein